MSIPKDIFLLGIGGMGMTPLALYLHEGGYNVEGYDDFLQESTRTVLDKAGVKVQESYDLPKQSKLIARSSAVAESDERLSVAAEKGISLLRRGELLAEALKDKKVIAVVGSHGKTTTAGMLVHALGKSSFKFDYILGGLFRDEELMPASYSDAEWVVVEVDESDGTIELFNPDITVLLNLDWDHSDHYASEEDMIRTFSELLSRTQLCVFVPETESRLKDICDSLSCDVYTYGESGDYKASVSKSSMNRLQIQLSGEFPDEELELPYGGRFNALNTVAAMAVGKHLASDLPINALSDFKGILRRQDLLHEEADLKILSDYGHHPREISELLESIKDYGGENLIVVFQPHRYSRTRQFASEFAKVLSNSNASKIILLPVYAASEEEDEAGKTERIYDAFADTSNVDLAETYESVSEILDGSYAKDAIILFLGAGDINEYAARYVSERKQKIDDWFENVSNQMKSDSILERDELLAKKTTLRLGGRADFFAEPSCIDDLSLLLSTATEINLPVFILGRGSNLIITDDGYKGLVIHLHHPTWRRLEEMSGDRILVGAGLRLQALSSKACKMGLSGFEFLEGIPGSVGGALRMNAGAMGGWMFQVVDEVEFVRMNGEVVHMKSEDLDVGYRYCEDLKTSIATTAILKSPSREEVDTIKTKMKDFSTHRISSQPQEPSAGCIFKNPEGNHAGKIIDELGLKGYRIGNAEISTVHGNFIINRGGASSDDVITLIRHIRKCAKSERGIDLQPEVMLVGKTWEQVL